MILVVGGLGSVAYAADPVNEVYVEFYTDYLYWASEDSFTNHEVVGYKSKWDSYLHNWSDASGGGQFMTLVSALTVR